MAFGMSAASAALVGSVGAPIVGGLLSSNAASNAADTQAAATGRGIDETKRQYDTSRADLAPYREAGTAALKRLQLLLGPKGARAETGKYQYGGTTYDSYDALKRQIVSDYSVGGIGDPNSTAGQAQIERSLASATPVMSEAADPDAGSLLSKFTTEDMNADPVYNSGLQFGLDEGTKAIERRAAAGGGYDSGATLKALTRFGNDYGSTKAADSRARFVEDQNNQFGKLSGVAGMGSGATTTGINAGTASAGNLASLYTGQGNASAAAGIASGNALSAGFTGASNAYGQYNLLQQLTGGGARALAAPSNVTGVD